MQHHHGHDDTGLALPHVELLDGTWVVHQPLRKGVLSRPDLKFPLHFKHQPLGMFRSVPGTVHFQLLHTAQ